MQVETYEVEEIKGELGNMAADATAIDLCNELGLTGQCSLANTESCTRNPFRLITNEENNVFRTCFPEVTTLKNYRDGIIPVRVLELIKRATEADFKSTDMNVWHAGAGKPDPILIGTKTVRPEGWSWDRIDTYLLARWGDSLETFEKLKMKAESILLNRWINEVEKIRAKLIGVDKARLQVMATEACNGHTSIDSPYFSWQAL